MATLKLGQVAIASKLFNRYHKVTELMKIDVIKWLMQSIVLYCYVKDPSTICQVRLDPVNSALFFIF